MRVAHEERRGYNPKDGTKQNIIREIMLYLEEKLLWRSPATINDVLKGVFRKASLPVDQILSTELRKVLGNLKRFFEKPTITATFTKTPFSTVQLCFLAGLERYRSPGKKTFYSTEQSRPKYHGSGNLPPERVGKISEGNINEFPA